MKKSEFRKNYIILANLYGAISIEEAYNVLRHYYNDLSYDSLYNDCKARVEKNTNHYLICYLGDDSFLITKDIFEHEVVQNIIDNEREDRYIPETYEEFSKWEKLNYLTINEEIHFKSLCSFINKYYNFTNPTFSIKLCIDLTELKNLPNDNFDHRDLLLAYTLLTSVKQGLNLIEDMEYIKSHLKITNKYVLEEYKSISTIFAYNIKKYINCGYSDFELAKIKECEAEDIWKHLDKTTKTKLKNGEINPFEYLINLENSDLPSSVKNSLSDEVIKIINKKIKEN